MYDSKFDTPYDEQRASEHAVRPDAEFHRAKAKALTAETLTKIAKVSTAATAPPSAHLPRSESDLNERSLSGGTGAAAKLPDAAREFGLLTRSDVQREEPAVPLIHGLINKGQLIMIAGPSGSGKSVLQLHLSAAMLNAGQVFGCIIPKPARFLYINLEGELKPRLQSIEQLHEGWSFPEPNALFLNKPWQLNDKDSVESLAHHVMQAGGVDVIFIDTLNRAMPGSDENLSTDMGVVIEHCTKLIRLTGAAVVLTHHTGKSRDKGPRGHSSLYAAVDTCLIVEKSASGVRSVKLDKTRQGPADRKYYFTIESIHLGEDQFGLPIVSPAISEVEDALEGVRTATPLSLTTLHQEALAALAGHLQTDSGGASAQAMSYDEALGIVKVAFCAIPTKHRSTRAREAIDALIDSGRLQRSNNGMFRVSS